MKFRWPLFALLLTSFVPLLTIAGCSSGGSHSASGQYSPGSLAVYSPGTRPVEATRSSLEGEWAGIAIQGREMLYCSLSLNASTQNNSNATRYDGTLAIQSLEDFWKGRSIESDIGADQYAVNVTFDKQDETFALKLKDSRGSYRDNKASLFRRGLTGVVDIRNNRLAASQPTQSRSLGDYIYFTRPKMLKPVLARYKAFNGKGPQVASGSVASSFGFRRDSLEKKMMRLLSGSGKASAKSLVDWSEPLYTEYPNIELRRIRHPQLELSVVGLFDDALFTHYFGKPFDELSNGKLDGIYTRLKSDFEASRDKREKDLSALSGMFHRSRSGQSTLQGVWARRIAVGWAKNQTARLEALLSQPNSSDAAWESIAAIERSFQSTPLASQLLWPDETSEVHNRISLARRGVAEPILQAKLNRLTNSEPSLWVMNALANWESSNRKYLEHLLSSSRHTMTSQAKDSLNHVVSTLIPSDVAQLQSLGSGLLAVEQGNDWLNAINTKYSQVRHTAAFKDALEQFYARRNNDLTEARDEMLATIREMDSGSLKTITARWLASPRDANHSVASEVRAAVRSRENQIAHEHQLALQALAIRALNDSLADSSLPLQYIDFSRFSASKLMETIYYGGTVIDDQFVALDALLRGNFGDAKNSLQDVVEIQTAFKQYHIAYYELYGNTNEKRARGRIQGENWTREPLTITTTTMQGGIVVDRSERPDIHIREDFFDAYSTTLENASGALAITSLFDALSSGSERPGVQLLKDVFEAEKLTPATQKATFKAFLQQYKDEYPATIRHFELNLQRAYLQQPLVRIVPIPPE